MKLTVLTLLILALGSVSAIAESGNQSELLNPHSSELFPIPITEQTERRNSQPVKYAATKFGSFFKSIFQKPAPATTPTNALPSMKAMVAPIDLSHFTKGQMDGAIKQALGNGLTNAIARLGATGGFLTNKSVRIPMPEQLKKVEAGLRRYRQDAIADAFVNTMNSAAEKAVPLAAPIFQDALQKLSVEDAARILSGPADSATQYFRKATSADLTKLFKSKVVETTEKAGLTSAYKNLTERLRFGTLFLNYDTGDLDNYVTEKTLDGLFSVVAEEERKIRTDPVARTTDLLKSVFGSLMKK